MQCRYLDDFRRGISVFAIFSHGIAVLGTPQCPPLCLVGFNQCLSIHLAFQFVIVVLVFYSSFNHHMHADRYVHGHVVFTKGEFAAKHLCLKQCSDPNRTTKY